MYDTSKQTQAVEKFQAATEFYIQSLRDKGRSEKTLANYKIRLDLFKTWWTENTAADADPCFSTFQAWAEHLRQNGKSPSTIRQYLVEMRCFYAFITDETLEEKQFYARNPVSKRLFPDVRKDTARPYETFLTDEQAALLWENRKCGRQAGANWFRNYAITVLLLSTMIRNAELLDLTPADLDFENGELTVERGKGNKYRVIDFPPIAQTAVKLYLNSGVRPEECEDTDPLFGTQSAHTFGGNPNTKAENWHRGTAQWLSDLVERHVLAVTGVSGISSHDLRHVGARLDLNTGMSMEELQSKLGHSKPETTVIYAGRLGTKRNRAGAMEALQERERQALFNQALLARA